MDEEAKELLRRIDNRLKWLLKFEAEDYFDDGATNKEQIRVLYQMGFDNSEMAELVNTSEGSVRGALSTLRDEGKID